jgi:indolepyruvate ferredoxin oxidoreductase alpha subunit
MKKVLLGDEAIAYGALSAGVSVATTYPGTPASEIGDTFSTLAKERKDFYFEYSVNEKVALEVAAGAAFFGARSIVSFKHFGLNVASDSTFPLSYHGLKAGMLIVVSDDPQCWSSGQSEQDSRYYARIAHMPMLEPSSPQECYDFVIKGFDLSEKLGIPVIIRLTTRVAYAKGIVKFRKQRKREIKKVSLGEFKAASFNNMPPNIIDCHKRLHEKLKSCEKIFDFCKIEGSGNFGIIVSGVPYLYVKDILEKMKLEEKISILKIGSWPYPRDLIKRFLAKKKKVLVIEEIEGILEKEIKEIAFEIGWKGKILGKDILPNYGELKINDVESAIRQLLGLKAKSYPERLDVIPRWPVLCPGCPHRATFYEIKRVFGDSIYCGDIGCYILGIYKPLETQDFIISMGASEGIAHGIKKVRSEQTIAFVGDSTFFHAGIPPLINAVYNKNFNRENHPIIVILNNMSTAMTGHQPHPGTGITGMGSKEYPIKAERIASSISSAGSGSCAVFSINPFNLKESVSVLEEVKKKSAEMPCVVVSNQECRLQFMRKARREKVHVPIFKIDKEKCKKCGACLRYGCPAIHKEEKNEEYYIDSSFCWGCSVCAQICPYGAIVKA